MDQPKTASAVVIGGGVVGCSIAYNLARRGLRDVVVIERETVGSGTTSKAAGGIRVQFPTETEIRFSLEAIRVFERFQDEFGVDPGYKKIGYLFLLSEEQQLRAFEPRIALQTRLGADVRLVTPDDARKLVPALRVDDLIAAVWGPGDGLAGPAEVTAGFARRARELGVKIVEGVRVVSLERAQGRVSGVTTSAGAIAAPLVINGAGPSGSVATVSSIRPPPAATSRSGCSTASRLSIFRSSIPLGSTARAPLTKRPRTPSELREDRRRPRDPRRYPGQAPAQDVLHHAGSSEFRLRPHRDDRWPHRLGRGRVPRK